MKLFNSPGNPQTTSNFNNLHASATFRISQAPAVRLKNGDKSKVNNLCWLRRTLIFFV